MIGRGVVDGPDGLVEKDTKTHQVRRLSLDATTANRLRDQLTVTVGGDDKGSPKRAYRNVRGTEKEATRALAALVAEAENRLILLVAANASKSMTVTDLVEWYLDSLGTIAASTTRRWLATAKSTDFG